MGATDARWRRLAWILVGALLLLQAATAIAPRWTAASDLSDGLELSLSPADPAGWSDPYWGSDLRVYIAEDASVFQSSGVESRQLTVWVTGSFARMADDVTDGAGSEWVLKSNFPVTEIRPIVLHSMVIDSIGEHEVWTSEDWQPWDANEVPMTVGTISFQSQSAGPGLQTVMLVSAFKVDAPVTERLVDPHSRKPVEEWRIRVGSERNWVSVPNSNEAIAIVNEDELPSPGVALDGQASVTLCETCSEATTASELLVAGGQTFGEAMNVGVGETRWTGSVEDGVAAGFSRAWLPWSWLSQISGVIWGLIVAAVAGVVVTWLIDGRNGTPNISPAAGSSASTGAGVRGVPPSSKAKGVSRGRRG